MTGDGKSNVRPPYVFQRLSVSVMEPPRALSERAVGYLVHGSPEHRPDMSEVVAMIRAAEGPLGWH